MGRAIGWCKFLPQEIPQPTAIENDLLLSISLLERPIYVFLDIWVVLYKSDMENAGLIHE
jgi:hypothetical protein